MKTDNLEKILCSIDKKTLGAVIGEREKRFKKLDMKAEDINNTKDNYEELVIEEETRGEKIRRIIFKTVSAVAAVALIAGMIYVARIPLRMNNNEFTPAVGDTESAEALPLPVSELAYDESAPVDTEPVKEFPLSGSELPYDESAWADANFIKYLSEYQYILNFQTRPWSTNSPWLSRIDPGDYAHVSIAGYGNDPSILIKAISADIEKYNSTYKTSNLFYSVDKYTKCASGTYKIAIFIAEATTDGETIYNYHFYRQDSDGYWSYKLNLGAVRHTDSNDILIIDPEAAAKDDWGADNIVFVGYYAITPWNLLYDNELIPASADPAAAELFPLQLYSLSGSELPYDESAWADTDFSEYRYILNCQTEPCNINNPGDYAHVSIEGYENDPSILIEAISADIEKYNSDYKTSNLFYSVDKYAECAPGTYKIAVFIAEVTADGETVYNYHIYRQDSDGFWSYKLNNGAVHNTDSRNFLIVDPDVANKDDWNADRIVLVGYYAVTPWNHMIY